MYDDLPKLFIAATPCFSIACNFKHSKALWVFLGGRPWLNLAEEFVGFAEFAWLAGLA